MASLKSLTLTLSNARATGLIVVMLLEELISIVDAFTRWLGRHHQGAVDWAGVKQKKPSFWKLAARRSDYEVSLSPIQGVRKLRTDRLDVRRHSRQLI